MSLQHQCSPVDGASVLWKALGFLSWGFHGFTFIRMQLSLRLLWFLCVIDAQVVKVTLTRVTTASARVVRWCFGVEHLSIGTQKKIDTLMVSTHHNIRCYFLQSNQIQSVSEGKFKV